MFSSSVVAALVALPFVAQSAYAQTCSRNYTVQANDWCDTISAAQNVSTYQLAVVNNGVIDPACNNLVPGNNICLGWVGQDCTTTYVVKLGDTCDDIASANGINSTTLFNNNPQLDAQCDNLYVGEVLCAADSVVAPSPPAGSSIPAASVPATATLANPSATLSSMSVTPAPTSASAATPSSTDDGDDSGDDDGDDSDLPWCDEL
ncbi:hypothetical protein AcV5_003111 [Taiwanofungus camphoratus]|nr:hypothetical protein AcV5_003111 [Antrodia cinnamomea]